MLLVSRDVSCSEVVDVERCDFLYLVASRRETGIVMDYGHVVSHTALIVKLSGQRLSTYI